MSELLVANGIAVLALLIASYSLWLAVVMTRRLAQRDPLAVPPRVRKMLGISQSSMRGVAFTDGANSRERLAFVANPTKEGVTELRESIYRACSIRYLPEPLWLYTTEDDAGEGVAREAVAAGVDVVVAVGGDGTVRAVAAALVGKKTTLGILPLGTGNLFARNLDIPVNDSAAALRAIFSGTTTPVDVGWVDIHKDKHSDPQSQLFLVIAGVGLDAEMVAGADDKLKKRFGWTAYFVALLRPMRGKRIDATVSVGDTEEANGLMRAVLVGNCGKLPGGLQLLPDASLSDGLLDIAIMDARGGFAGWAALFGEVVTQGAGIAKPLVPNSWRVGRIDHVRALSATVNLATPQKVQIDGEPMGRAIKLEARIDPGALRVRVPVQT